MYVTISAHSEKILLHKVVPFLISYGNFARGEFSRFSPIVDLREIKTAKV